jgi:hypothetical protein
MEAMLVFYLTFQSPTCSIDEVRIA